MSDWPAHAGAGTFIPMEWNPAPPPARPRRRGRLLVGLVVIVLLATSGGFAWLARHDQQAAERWRALAGQRAAQLDRLTTQVQVANSRIGLLNGQVTTLDGQISGLQGQLSSVADQKEKVVDQESVLQQLLSAAGNVADDLQSCIDATNHFDTAFNTAFDGSNFSQLGSLEDQAQNVDRTCNTAESANEGLQSAIQSSP